VIISECRVLYKNKFGNECVCWFHWKVIYYDARSYERKNLHISFSGTTLPKWGTEMLLPIMWPLLGWRRFCNCMKWHTNSVLLSCGLQFELLYSDTNYGSLKCRQPLITLLTLQNRIEALRNKQWLRLAHSRSSYWNTFHLRNKCSFLVLRFLRNW
jgi:hypothetical protein